MSPWKPPAPNALWIYVPVVVGPGYGYTEVKWLAARLREINRQASVLVITLDGRAKKITANQQ
jgi:hypothetical protein